MSTGISMTQNSFMLMLGQYFKKRRELVEMIVVSGTGGGFLAMSSTLNYFVRRHGWRLGLQAVTLILLSIFFMGEACNTVLRVTPSSCSRNVLQISLTLSSAEESNPPPEEPDQEDQV